MATISTLTIGNIQDVLKFKAPDGKAMDSPVNTLVEIDHLSADLPALPANAGLTHHGLRTIQLPTGYLVDIGGSWKSSKSVHEPFVEGLMELRSSYEAPTDTFKNEPREVGEAMLQAEVDGHWHALSQGCTNIMLNGHDAPNMSAIVGLMKRPPYTTYDNAFCFSVGGSGSNLRSAWLIKPGVDTVHALYNGNHPTLGIEQEDKGEDREDSLGSSNDEHRYRITIEFMLTRGLCIKDQTACKRICNIPVDPSSYPGEDVANMAIEASIVNATKRPGKTAGGFIGAESTSMDTWMLYCDERLYAKLVRGINDRTVVRRSEDNAFSTSLPMIGDNIIVRRMDALNHALGSGETAVSAA